MIPDEPFPATPWRRRLLVLVLALATATTVVLSITGEPGGARHKRPPPPDAPLCTAQQSTGCVGGMAAVIVTPALAPASAPR